MTAFEFDASTTTFYSVLDLVRKRVAIAEIVTAVESGGLQGYDRFGRYGKFTSGADEIRQILDFLADQHSWEVLDQELDPAMDSPCWNVDVSHPAGHIGWRPEDLPQFQSGDLPLQEAQSPTKHKGGRNNVIWTHERLVQARELAEKTSVTFAAKKFGVSRQRLSLVLNRQKKAQSTWTKGLCAPDA